MLVSTHCTVRWERDNSPNWLAAQRERESGKKYYVKEGIKERRRNSICCVRPKYRLYDHCISPETISSLEWWNVYTGCFYKIKPCYWLIDSYQLTNKLSTHHLLSLMREREHFFFFFFYRPHSSLCDVCDNCIIWHICPFLSLPLCVLRTRRWTCALCRSLSRWRSTVAMCCQLWRVWTNLLLNLVEKCLQWMATSILILGNLSNCSRWFSYRWR